MCLAGWHCTTVCSTATMIKFTCCGGRSTALSLSFGQPSKVNRRRCFVLQSSVNRLRSTVFGQPSGQTGPAETGSCAAAPPSIPVFIQITSRSSPTDVRRSGQSMPANAIARVADRGAASSSSSSFQAQPASRSSKVSANVSIAASGPVSSASKTLFENPVLKMSAHQVARDASLINQQPGRARERWSKDQRRERAMCFAGWHCTTVRQQ